MRKFDGQPFSLNLFITSKNSLLETSIETSNPHYYVTSANMAEDLLFGIFLSHGPTWQIEKQVLTQIIFLVSLCSSKMWFHELGVSKRAENGISTSPTSSSGENSISLTCGFQAARCEGTWIGADVDSINGFADFIGNYDHKMQGTTAHEALPVPMTKDGQTDNGEIPC